jgi:signal transduction histidine kinase
LFGISATLDAMEARFRGRQEYDKYVATLRRECDRMGKLIQQLLIYGRPPTTQPLPASLPDVVAEALETASPMAKRSEVSIASATAGKLALAPIERDRLLMVLQNLLENAIQHSPAKGEVEIAVIQVNEENRIWLQCTVEDSGPGFSPEDLLNVFEPFYSRRSGGAGLGLSIVRQTVEQVGGKIWAGNRPRGGGIVTFQLPAALVQEEVNASEYSAHRG